MAHLTSWSEKSKSSATTRNADRAAVLAMLRHRYVSERQQAMVYRQHADRIHDPNLRIALYRIAAEELEHAHAIGAKIIELGEKLPEVIPIHVAKEQNSWLYLRTDLEAERRCSGEVQDGLPPVGGEFADVAALLDRIDADGRRHRDEIRSMMAQTDPQSAGPP